MRASAVVSCRARADMNCLTSVSRLELPQLSDSAGAIPWRNRCSATSRGTMLSTTFRGFSAEPDETRQETAPPRTAARPNPANQCFNCLSPGYSVGGVVGPALPPLGTGRIGRAEVGGVAQGAAEEVAGVGARDDHHSRTTG